MAHAEGSTCSREPFVDAIVHFLAHERASAAGVRSRVEQVLDEFSPAALEQLNLRLSCAGTDWTYYARDRMARRLHHALAPEVLRPEPVVTGVQHLAAAAGRPVVLIGNHLSYSDANVIDVVLQNAGAKELVDRLTVIAGPKVYSTVTRRFSSLCFGTIKVPQSAERSSEEAVMGPRDIARAARRSIGIAHERLGLGEALLLFPEGTRSRSGAMQPFLPGTARYLESPDVLIVPVGITGTERLFPMNSTGLHPVAVSAHFGAPIEADELRHRVGNDRTEMMTALAQKVAELLPPQYRGVYA